MDHPLKIPAIVDLAQLLIQSALWINVRSSEGWKGWITVGEHVWPLGWR